MQSGTDKPKPRPRKRKHTLKQLVDRPLTIPTCEGAVTVTAERKNGQLLVAVLAPEGIDVAQRPPADCAASAQCDTQKAASYETEST